MEFDPAPEYAFRGGILKSIEDRSTEILSAGPAGSGKSLAILRKLHLVAMQYPGCRLLIVRKTRASLTESTLVTFERDILGPNHPILTPSNLRRVRQAYRYPNGSEIIVAGMDKPDKVLSSEYDICFISEATELSQEDWEVLASRLRNGRVPYQQMIADCNPTTPMHWLYKRSQTKGTDGEPTLKLIETVHKDNPRFWDADKNDWTDHGKQYLARLEKLTGPRRARFLEGKWKQAEGIIFEDFDDQIHMVNPFPIPREWPRYISIDFGFTNPLSIAWYATDPDGRIFMFREIYKTRMLIEDAALGACRLMNAWDEEKKCHRWTNESEPKPRAVVCDHDAEGRAVFERHTGLTTIPADKKVLAGIQEASERFRKAKDGRPRIFFFRDALTHKPDPELVMSGKPIRGVDELPGYRWDIEAGVKERPVKEDDHFCDGVRYLSQHLAAKKLVKIF